MENIDEWDFDVVRSDLQSLLDDLLTPEERTKRSHYMAIAEDAWYSKSEADRHTWLDHLNSAQRVLREVNFKKDKRFFLVFDELFTGPAKQWSGQILTAGELMADAHKYWKHLSQRFGRSNPTNQQVLEVLRLEINQNHMDAVSALYHYRWVDDGFPVVKISPKFAAASMCTSFDDDVIKSLRSPWRAFNIEMPIEDVLYQIDDNNAPMRVSHIQVYYGEEAPGVVRKWSIALKSGIGCIYNHSIWMTSEELCSPQKPDDDFGLPWRETREWDIQSIMLAGRIVANVVCALTEPKHVRKVSPRSHESWAKRPVVSARGENLEARIFQLTTPVTIDLVPAVREYQMHPRRRKGWKLMIQSTVKGHRKMQPCGPRHSQRQQIWIEPYPRGHPNAPIAVRAHIIKDEA